MRIEVVDGLKASVVFLGVRLLPLEADITSFRAASPQREVRQETPLVVGTNPPPREEMTTLTMSRERVTIFLSDQRSSVEREYLSKEDLPELADIILTCIESSTLDDHTPSAFGYNVELVCEQKSGMPARTYLAEHLLQPGVAGDLPWDLSVGSTTLTFSEAGRRWTIAFEPRFRDADTPRIFIQTNHHFEKPTFPSKGELVENLQLTWERTVQLLRNIDKGAS